MTHALPADRDPVHVKKFILDDNAGLPVASARFGYASATDVAIARAHLAPLVDRFVPSGASGQLVVEFAPDPIVLTAIVNEALAPGGRLLLRMPLLPRHLVRRLGARVTP